MLENTYLEESRRHYNKLIRDGEAEQLVLNVQSKQQQQTGNILLRHLGDVLIKSGTWLKQQKPMDIGIDQTPMA